MSRGWPGVATASVLTVLSLASCGGDDDSSTVSPTAERGREIARTSGCSACHGADGQGGVGPAFVGLYGSQVTLADGSTVTADAAYLTEAIREPSATKVAGYDVDMPSNDLSDEQIADVIAFIRELTGPQS